MRDVSALKSFSIIFLKHVFFVSCKISSFLTKFIKTIAIKTRWDTRKNRRLFQNSYIINKYFSPHGATAPCGAGHPKYQASHSHSGIQHSVGRDELSARHRNLYLTIQNTDTHLTRGIRTHNPSKQAASDQRLRPCGHGAWQLRKFFYGSTASCGPGLTISRLLNHTQGHTYTHTHTHTPIHTHTHTLVRTPQDERSAHHRYF